MIAIAMIGNIDKGQNKIIEYILNQLNDFIDEKVFLDFYKGNKLQKLFHNKANFRKMDFDKFDNWDDIEKYVKRQLSDVDKLIFFRTPMMSGIKIDDVTLVQKFATTIKTDNKFSIKFFMIRKILEKCMLIKVAADLMSIDVIQFVIDPQEIDFRHVFYFTNYRRYFILKRDYDKYAPMYEYEMSKEICSNKKEVDLFFIGSILTEDRYFLYDLNDQFEGIDSIEFKVFDKDKFKNNRISQNEYYHLLSKSKYTLICKPYENDSFSIIRFFEAVCNNCIPLILDDVNLSEILCTFEDIYDIIKRNKLVVKASNIQKRIKRYEEDKNVIEEIMKSKSFEKITNCQKVKKFYEKLLEE
jgi:hypothetical protein